MKYFDKLKLTCDNLITLPNIVKRKVSINFNKISQILTGTALFNKIT